MIKPGIYKHYKGNLYKVHYVATHSETMEQHVVYECLYENLIGKFWVRPLNKFTEKIKTEDKIIPRFQFISDE